MNTFVAAKSCAPLSGMLFSSAPGRGRFFQWRAAAYLKRSWHPCSSPWVRRSPMCCLVARALLQLPCKAGEDGEKWSSVWSLVGTWIRPSEIGHPWRHGSQACPGPQQDSSPVLLGQSSQSNTIHSSYQSNNTYINFKKRWRLSFFPIDGGIQHTSKIRSIQGAGFRSVGVIESQTRSFGSQQSSQTGPGE